MRRLALAAGAAALAVLPAAAPLPPVRAGRPARPPAPSEAPARQAPALPEPARGACLERLRGTGSLAEKAPPPPPGTGGASCAIADPIRLSSVAAGQAASVQLPDKPLVDCALAEPLAAWIGGIVAPVLAARFGSPLAAIRTGPGFECRGRNRQAGGKMSAHARGFALDLASFVLSDGRALPVSAMPKFGAPAGPGEPGASLQALRVSACGWFTTVLGPGSDAYHGDHLHVDLERHGSSDRYRICQ